MTTPEEQEGSLWTHLSTHTPAGAHLSDQILTSFNQALMNISNIGFFKSVFSTHQTKDLRSQLLNHITHACLILKESVKPTSMTYHFAFPPDTYEGVNDPISL